MYHEKQIKELCALHALNNLFQDSSAFTKSFLDNLCNALSPENWINPHRSLLGTGNYDVNVIMAALTTKGCGIIWFDKRKDPNIIILDNIVGFILNVPSEYRIGPFQLPFRRKHWITIRSLQGLFYNLDSKLDAPEVIGKGIAVTNYIREELRCKDIELLVVVTQEVERDKTWCSNDSVHFEADKGISLLNSHSLHNFKGDADAFSPFSSPGLRFIDQEPSSMDSSLEGNLNYSVDSIDKIDKGT